MEVHLIYKGTSRLTFVYLPGCTVNMTTKNHIASQPFTVCCSCYSLPLPSSIICVFFSLLASMFVCLQRISFGDVPAGA